MEKLKYKLNPVKNNGDFKGSRGAGFFKCLLNNFRSATKDTPSLKYGSYNCQSPRPIMKASE